MKKEIRDKISALMSSKEGRKRFVSFLEEFMRVEAFCERCGSAVLGHQPHCTFCGAENKSLIPELCMRVWEKTPEELRTMCSSESHQRTVEGAIGEDEEYELNPYCEWCGEALTPQPCKVALTFLEGKMPLKEYEAHVPTCKDCSLNMGTWKAEMEMKRGGQEIPWEDFLTRALEWGTSFSTSINEVLEKKLPKNLSWEKERKILDAFFKRIKTSLKASKDREPRQ